MKTTEYTVTVDGLREPLLLALVSDTHGAEPDPILKVLRAKKPDAVLMPGDIFERIDGVECEKRENAMTLLRESTRLCPVFYSTGNHEDGGTKSWSGKWKNQTAERCYDPVELQRIRETGTTVLLDSCVSWRGLWIGGLCSGLILPDCRPKLSWLSEFCEKDGPKLLLCHHPEYYPKYLKGLPLDLIVSGHAHGGQWRVFGRGVFAPGQGLLPKYTSGVHDGRFVISRGLNRGGMIPRFFNETEVVLIHLEKAT